MLTEAPLADTLLRHTIISIKQVCKSDENVDSKIMSSIIHDFLILHDESKDEDLNALIKDGGTS